MNESVKVVKTPSCELTWMDPLCICISVADNGTGIPMEIIDKIFIPFFTTSEGGPWIGLSLARQIMHHITDRSV